MEFSYINYDYPLFRIKDSPEQLSQTVENNHQPDIKKYHENPEHVHTIAIAVSIQILQQIISSMNILGDLFFQVNKIIFVGLLNLEL